MVERRESKTMINNKMRDMEMDNKMKANNKMKDMEMDLLKNAEFKEAFDEFDQVILYSLCVVCGFPRNKDFYVFF